VELDAGKRGLKIGFRVPDNVSQRDRFYYWLFRSVVELVESQAQQLFDTKWNPAIMDCPPSLSQRLAGKKVFGTKGFAEVCPSL
jgi:hypothetical protein